MKLIRKGISIAIVFVLTYLLTMYIFSEAGMLKIINTKTTYGSNTLPRMLEAETVSEVDILFIGSSQVYKGFDPRIFKRKGISTFNLGSNAQTPYNTYYVLKEHLPHIKTKYVVMDLYWVPLELDGTEPGVDLISNMRLSRNTLEMALVSKNSYLINTFTLAALNQMIYGYKLEDYAKSNVEQEPARQVYVSGGYVESQLNQNLLTYEDLASIKPYEVSPEPIQLEYIDKVAQLCKEYGVELIFTIGPVTDEYKHKMTNYAEYRKLMSSLANKNGVLLLDYNTRPDLRLSSKYDFLDENHLSQTGVIKYNGFFINDIVKLNQLALGK